MYIHHGAHGGNSSNCMSNDVIRWVYCIVDTNNMPDGCIKARFYKTVSPSIYKQSVSNNTKVTQLSTTLIDHIIHKNTFKLQENYGVEIVGGWLLFCLHNNKLWVYKAYYAV